MKKLLMILSLICTSCLSYGDYLYISISITPKSGSSVSSGRPRGYDKSKFRYVGYKGMAKRRVSKFKKVTPTLRRPASR